MTAWADRYLGIPYADKASSHAGCDCWGLVRLVYSEIHNIHLGQYAEHYTTCVDPHAGVDLIQAGILDGWEKVQQAQPFDLLVFRVGGNPWHCGLATQMPGEMLHAPCFDRRGKPVLSCCVDYTTPLYRLDGVYRHGALAR